MARYSPVSIVARPLRKSKIAVEISRCVSLAAGGEGRGSPHASIALRDQRSHPAPHGRDGARGLMSGRGRELTRLIASMPLGRGLFRTQERHQLPPATPEEQPPPPPQSPPLPTPTTPHIYSVKSFRLNSHHRPTHMEYLVKHESIAPMNGLLALGLLAFG